MARLVASETASSVDFVQADYHALPFLGAHFDIAVFPQNIVECSYDELAHLLGDIRRVLCCGGHLVLTMKDGVSTDRFPPQYDILSGKINGEITVPNRGRHEYPSYFWTVAFATHIISQQLKFTKSVPMDRGIILLVFSKESD